MLACNDGKYQSMPYNIPEEKRSLLHRVGSLKLSKMNHDSRISQSLRNFLHPVETYRLVKALRYMSEGRGFHPDVVTGIFHWRNHSGRTMALGLTQPLIEMSTRNISRGQRWPVRRADNPTTFICRLPCNLGASTSWNTSGPVQVCSGIAWPLLNVKTHCRSLQIFRRFYQFTKCKVHKRNLSDTKYGYSILLWDIAIKRMEVNTSYRRILRPISEISTTFYLEADIWSLLPSLESLSLLTNRHLRIREEYYEVGNVISVYSSRSQSSPTAFRLCPVVPAATWRITVISVGNVIRFFLTFPLRLLPRLYPEGQNVSAMVLALDRHAITCGTDGEQSDIPTGPTPSDFDFSFWGASSPLCVKTIGRGKSVKKHNCN